MNSFFSKKLIAEQRITFIAVILASGFAACNAPAPDSLEQDAQMLANLTCEARHIREERFALADAIRFTEEEIKGKSTPETQKKLDSLLSLTEPIALRTKIMADSVKQALKQLQKARYKTPEQRKALDAAMMRYLEPCKIKQ